ncbi:MAG: ammonium transporter [Candidatus Margulisbacteria bacterium]|nr:ammonium transporter [Candidatus Margulisiibacteriota bacterium]
MSLEFISFTISNLWILIAAAMVFMMHLGFAALEAGLTRSKNTVNILFKNFGVLSIGLISYALIGFQLMYPGESFAGGFLGLSGMGISPGPEGLTPGYNPMYTYWTDFIFQAMFAATAATIVSGAVAERMKLSSFLLFTIILVGFIYPIVGMWKWGGGFLSTMSTPFYDFAGSTLVHSVGGWAALISVCLLGPRLGKYVNNQIVPIKPHSFALAAIGVFLLWFGWYGFNGGSVLSADPAILSLVFVCTAMGGAAGTMTAMLTSWRLHRRPDLANTLNGALAGLVGITAGADVFGPASAILVGGIAGVIVVFSAKFFDNRKIDDPVGAISVHLVCGVWGTLAVGLFGKLASPAQFVSQLIGISVVGVVVASTSYVCIQTIRKIIGIRVDKEDEIEGLDASEHKDLSYIYHHNPIVQKVGEPSES